MSTLNISPLSHNLPVVWAQSTHQVDKILVADLSISMAVSESQEHLPFVWVQLGAVALQQAPELACADVACVPRVKLKEKQTASGSVDRHPSALPHLHHHSPPLSPALCRQRPGQCLGCFQGSHGAWKTTENPRRPWDL